MLEHDYSEVEFEEEYERWEAEEIERLGAESYLYHPDWESISFEDEVDAMIEQAEMDAVRPSVADAEDA